MIAKNPTMCCCAAKNTIELEAQKMALKHNFNVMNDERKVKIDERREERKDKQKKIRARAPLDFVGVSGLLDKSAGRIAWAVVRFLLLFTAVQFLLQLNIYLYLFLQMKRGHRSRSHEQGSHGQGSHEQGSRQGSQGKRTHSPKVVAEAEAEAVARSRGHSTIAGDILLTEADLLVVEATGKATVAVTATAGAILGDTVNLIVRVVLRGSATAITMALMAEMSNMVTLQLHHLTLTKIMLPTTMAIQAMDEL